jgi:hypothetical protein
MKPKLKPDVYWVPHPEGMLFMHPAASLKMKGRTAIDLMDALAPYLDGSAELGELVADLPADTRSTVVDLVTALHRAGLIKDAGNDEPHGLSAEELAAYQAEIAYIDYYLDSAARRFERYRRTPAVCVGAGLSFVALVHACLASGLAQVTALVTNECPTDLARLREYRELAAERDPGQRLVIGSLGAGPDRLLAATDAGNLVLHVSDISRPDRGFKLSELCRRQGRLFVQGVTDADVAWIGPAAGPGDVGWESAWLRRAANARRPAGADAFTPATTGSSVYLAGPTAAIVANRVSFLAFRELTGIAAADQTATDPARQRRTCSVQVDLETLRTTEHWYLPHPLIADATPETSGEFAARWSAFREAAMADDDAFSAGAAGCSDPALGAFVQLDEAELEQLPLHVARAAVADTFALLDTTGGPAVVTGAGVSFAAARQACGRAALSAYCALAVDQRRLLTAEEHGGKDQPPDDVTAFAQNLLLDKPELVSAPLVFPALRLAGTAASEFRLPVGLGVGENADAALRNGLLSHAVAITAASAADGGPHPGLRLDEVAAGDPAIGRYLELVRIAGVPLRCFDVTSALGIAVYALCAGSRTITYTAACDLGTGLETVLLEYQGAVTAVAPELPRTARAGDRVVSARPVMWPTWQEVAEAFFRNGHQVHARPAGHDPSVSAVIPTIVQVAVSG